MTPLCELCQRPDPTAGYVCASCAGKLLAPLQRAVDLIAEVETSVCRLSRLGDPGPRSRTLAPPSPIRPDGRIKHYADQVDGEAEGLPVDFARDAQASAAAAEIGTWARHLAEERGLVLTRSPVGGPWCATWGCHHGSCEVIRSRRLEPGAAYSARLILGHVEWLRHRQEAMEALSVLRDAAYVILRVVDSPAPRWYAGPCWADTDDGRCETPLYARAADGFAKCRACGTQWEVTSRRQWLLDSARDTLAHAALIARALSALGVPVPYGTILSWAHRGRLVAHGRDALGRPTYRVGDVLDVATEAARRREEAATP